MCEKFAEDLEFREGNFAVNLKREIFPREIKVPRTPPPSPCTTLRRVVDGLNHSSCNRRVWKEIGQSVEWAPGTPPQKRMGRQYYARAHCPLLCPAFNKTYAPALSDLPQGRRVQRVHMSLIKARSVMRFQFHSAVLLFGIVTHAMSVRKSVLDGRCVAGVGQGKKCNSYPKKPQICVNLVVVGLVNILKKTGPVKKKRWCAFFFGG